MKQLLIFSTFLFYSLTAQACGNEYGYDLDGKRVFTRYFYLSKSHRHFNRSQLTNRLHELRAKNSNDFKDQSNIALYLMKLGHADSALMILKPLIEKHPNEYTLNSNIGTAYELTGDLDNALKYISKGYEINPDSHLKSEWIHIRILEAKIKERGHRGWIRKNPIVPVQELIEKMGDLRKYRHRENPLAYQIKTRVPFTPAPNAVIANLLETLAQFNEEHGTYENALLSYAYALEFHQPSRSYHHFINEKINALNETRRASGVKELPYEFKRMMNRADLDPIFLIGGVKKFAESQHQLDSLHLAYSDSLEHLQHQLDSAKVQQQTLDENEEAQNEDKSEDSSVLYMILLGLGGIIVGAVAVFAIKKK